MKRNWTKEQQEVIEHRNGNLLVSAGAGAGKTAVLVERMIQRILEEEAPIGINEFLVVTFTRAAASEMKERIGLVLEEKLEAEIEKDANSPAVKRLVSQISLLPEAEISTIDSFCKSVIMENVQKTDLDPSFRIANEAELNIIRAELMEDFLEQKYEDEDESFLNLVEYFERGKNDKKLPNLILDLVTSSESFPDRKGWFEGEIRKMDTDIFKGKVMEDFMQFLKTEFQSLLFLNARAIKLAEEEGGPLQYLSALQSDQELIESWKQAKTGEELFQRCSNIKFASLGRGKPKNKQGEVVEVDEERKEKVKAIRDAYKEAIQKKIKEKYFFASPEVIKKEYEVIKEVLIKLIRLANEYADRFLTEKKRRNIVDFSDLSHIALSILIGEDGMPTEVAKEYRNRFAEIMIDEYQDSNRIQDLLLSSISRETIGEPNLFMVGDVKQSIYGFRQAEPSIFLEKYHHYEEFGKKRKINLFRNFRSGKEVIDTVNTVFRYLMTEETGGLVYDEKAALVVGREDKNVIFEKNKTEFLFYDTDLEDVYEKMTEERNDTLDVKEAEASMIADRIKKLKDEGYSYSDITILLRSISEWGERFKKVLLAKGIPAVCETSTGYFRAWEVQIILACIRIIDNPLQDIPLTAVLLSPIGNFQETELAEMKLACPQAFSIWDVLNTSSFKKAEEFRRFLYKKRKEAIVTPVKKLIQRIYEDSCFYEYVSGMEGGEVRTANLDMLLVKAGEYEETSLFGLHSFVRYLEKLKKYEEDFGEAEISDHGEAVRIMSIHKSKGLEFPVVFVSGLAKKFNDMDARKSVVSHKDIGISTDYFNTETREENKGFFKNLISDKIRMDRLNEEIRILYVALTRAKDKLILTAAFPEVQDKIQRIRTDWEGITVRESPFFVRSSETLLDFVLPPLLCEWNAFVRTPEIFGIQDLYLEEGKELVHKEQRIESLFSKFQTEFSSLEERESYRSVEREFSYEYPFKEAVYLKPSMTISELKRLHLSEEFGYEEERDQKEEVRQTRGWRFDGFSPYIPEFEQKESLKEEGLSGADRGTLVHKLLSKLDFKTDYTKEEIQNQAEELSDQGSLSDFDLVSIYHFMKSDFAKRMRMADLRGELYRETPFAISVKKKIASEEETIVVQGIIDVWFYEDGEVILLDYKTDRVKKGEEALLMDRYRVQLSYYREALERVTGKAVKESYLYSLPLFKEIQLEEK